MLQFKLKTTMYIIHMSKHTDIAIIGGGMAGLSMALAAGKQGLDVLVVDKAPLKQQQLPSFDGRVSAISLGSKRMLDRLGAWSGMEAFAEPILDIRVSDGQSPFFLHYDHEEVGKDTGGQPFGWIIENRYIRQGLYDAVSELPNISFHQGSVTGLDTQSDKQMVALDDGSEVTASLVVGSDSKFSKMRELAGIAVHEVDYKQTALVCTIEHEKPHQGLAQERFLARGPFAVLPMQENKSSLVWVEPADLAEHYIELSEADENQEIQERVGDYLGEVQILGRMFSYPLKLTLAENFAAERLALVGDAAHAIHPIAGQGINLGFRDVAVLAELIAGQQELGLDIGSDVMLEKYARWRRLDTTSMSTVTDSLNRLFSNSIMPVKLARGLGLFVVSNMPPLKRIFMKHAMGVIGDLPALMKP